MLLGWGSDAFTQSKERNRMILTKQEIVEALKSNKCVVKFTKVNGEVREMPCTLREDLVPKYEHKTDNPKKVNENVVSVWCLDRNEWRSFRVDSLLELRIDLGMPVVL